MTTKKATKAAAKKSPAKTAAKGPAKAVAKKTAAASTPKAAEPKKPATHQEIAALAEQLWIERGRPHGSAHIDWLHAEQKLNG